MPTQHLRGASPSQGARFSQPECNRRLPLVRAIAGELVERRTEFRALRALRKELTAAESPEGLTVALDDVASRILEVEDRILAACEELTAHGLTVQRLNPVVVHFPGTANGSEVVFCWSESHGEVDHCHACDTEEVNCHVHPAVIAASVAS